MNNCDYKKMFIQDVKIDNINGNTHLVQIR